MASQPSVPSPKAPHYDAALASAALRGAWGDANPGRQPNGTELSWNELIRKWGKHGGGNTTLIHHIRDISLLYQSASSSHPTLTRSSTGQPTAIPSSMVEQTKPNGRVSLEETDYETGSSLLKHAPHPHRYLHRQKSRPSLESAHPTGSPSTSTPRKSATAYVSPVDLDGDDAPSEDAWSVGNGWWSGVDENQVDEVQEAITSLEGIISGGKLKAGEMESARCTLGYHLHAIGSHEDALRIGHEIQGDPTSGALEGDASVLERIRTKCHQGISAELLPTPDWELALSSYVSVVPLLRQISSIPIPTPSYLAGPSSPKIPFDSHRELHRQLSTALSRAAILSARTPDTINQTIRILRAYHTYSRSWPPSFRPIQRQRMLLLYLRALSAGYPPAGSPCEHPYTLDESVEPPSLPARTVWRADSTEAIRLGRSLLSSTTTFPRAGSVNYPVTAFTTLCVALADNSPSVSREVISTLWWSMTLTFQSQSILRHLVRLLAAVGDAADARKAFELYVQLVLKARETQQPDISLQLKRRPTEDVAAGPKEIQRQAENAAEEQGEQAEERKTQTAEAEVDNDEEFVEALLVGARLLLKDLSETDEAWRYVCLAGDVIDLSIKYRRTISPNLRGQVEECKGIVRMAMGMKGVDPSIRPTYQAQAIDHLTAATAVNSQSSSAFYHLALCQAEARSIEAASEAIRMSIELDSKNVQAWHLLALILTAQGDWDAASKAGEAGVSVWEEGEMADTTDEDGPSENPDESNPSIAAKDFAAAPSVPTIPTIIAVTPPVSSRPLLLPSGSFNPPRIQSRPPGPTSMSRAKQLENVIRLRMTLNIVVEKTLGPDVAMLRHQELFAFFSGRAGKNRGQHQGAYSRGMTGSVSATSMPSASITGGSKELGGSFVNVNVDSPPTVTTELSQDTWGSSMVAVQPPTPDVEGTPTDPLPVPNTTNVTEPESPRSPRKILSTASSPGNSTATSETESNYGGVKEKDVRKGLSKRLVSKHLHVPHGIGGRTSRPSSMRRTHTAEDLRTSMQRNRAASASTTALSVAHTAVHSHFRRSAGFTPPPPPPPLDDNIADHGRTPAESRILSNLWLMSAATFRRWGKIEQSLVAIEEAELLDPENPDVWVQLGLYHMSSVPPDWNAARPALTKAILLRPDHAPSLVNLSKLYLATEQVELAHSMLNQMTQDAAWYVPEAWFYLGKVCELQGREERARECWEYALGLEETRPARRWMDGVDRWL